MLRSELLEIISNGENSGVEFKRDDVRPEQLGKEIVALVNLRGGQILLGVEDDGTISGIQRRNLEEWVMDTVFAKKVHPMILPFYEEVLMADGKRVAIISFPQGTSKP
jgi:ATP-dependent DNA helicase RecG